MDQKDSPFPNPMPINAMQERRKKELLRRKRHIPVWRHPDYKDNRIVISWEIPGQADGVIISNPEQITTIALPKSMNIYEYEHWDNTEEGKEYLKSRYPECMAIAEKIDSKKEGSKRPENANPE